MTHLQLNFMMILAFAFIVMTIAQTLLGFVGA